MSSRNQQLFERAQRHIPGGVNSPVRAFRSVGGTPRFFATGSGARVVDVDGKSYVDYVGSWGPLILGHAHPEVVAAVRAAGSADQRIVRGSIGDFPVEEVCMRSLVVVGDSTTLWTERGMLTPRGYLEKYGA